MKIALSLMLAVSAIHLVACATRPQNPIDAAIDAKCVREIQEEVVR